MNTKLLLIITTLLLIITPHAQARVKLTTLPIRERVEVQLDHDDVTLIEEERIVPLVAGVNQIDFSWTNTSINAESVVFRVIGPASENPPPNLDVNILSVSYPPAERALVWQVASNRATAVRVRISYIINNIDRNFHYRAVTSADEKTLTLSQYLRVQNRTGESFDDTNIQLGYGSTIVKPIGANQTKQVLVQQFKNIPVIKTYTASVTKHGYLDQPENKLNVATHYQIENNIQVQPHPQSQLGQTFLPAGKVRLFQKDSQDTTAFIGEDVAEVTPINGEMNLYLGLAQDVVVRRIIADRKTERIAGNLFNQKITLRFEVENFKDEVVRVELIESMRALQREARRDLSRAPEWSLDDSNQMAKFLVPEKTNMNEATFRVHIPAREGDTPGKATYNFTFTLHNHF